MNADWFDGLHTFMRYICHRSWLGGWMLPQQKSYFALKLPHGWWIFGLDQALHGDIDVFQFKYFSDIAKHKVNIGFHFCFYSQLDMDVHSVVSCGMMMSSMRLVQKYNVQRKFVIYGPNFTLQRLRSTSISWIYDVAMMFSLAFVGL